VIIENMMAAIRQLSAEATIVLVEQNFLVASQLAEYLCHHRRRALGAGRQDADLVNDKATIHRYLGAA
jgi:branched-chain amino acid transport system ATP-binding protein